MKIKKIMQVLKNKKELLKIMLLYKMLVSQKIKELASSNNSFERKLIEDTYKELEQEKMKNISYLQLLIENDDKNNLEQKSDKLKTAVEYFDEIINLEVPNRMILQMIIDKIYWVPCEPIIVSPPSTFCELQKRNEEIAKNRNGMSWYLSFKNPEKCISADMEQSHRKLDGGKNK